MRSVWRQGRDLHLIGVTALVYGFLLAPFVVVVVASFDGSQTLFYGFPPRQFSLAWYWRIPGKYFEAFGLSLIVASVTALVSGGIGTVAAIGLARGDARGRQVMEAIFRLPLQIPFVVTGVVFLQFYVRLSDLIGANLAGTIWGLIIAHVFVGIPYSVGAVGAVLTRLNPRLEEAAESLGASPWSTFWRITFPLLRPGVFAGVLYAFIISFGDVPIAVFLSGPETTTLPVEIFQALQFDFDPAILALSALVVLFSLGLIVVVQRWVGLDIVVRTGQR